MTQLDYVTPQGPIGFTNRKSGLLVFGIILIILGSLSGCLALLSPVALLFGPATAGAATPQARPIIVAVVMYALVAVAFIWTGIGSIRARRWVRPVVVVFSTILLLVGILATAVMVIMLPSMPEAIQAGARANIPAGAPAPPRGAFVAGAAFAACFVFFIYIIIPGVFLWFYRQQEVRLTVEFYDPTPRWTDRCPMPVLGLSCLMALGAVGSLLGVPYLVAPFFGILLRGAAAAACYLALTGAFAAASVLVYRQRAAGWWLAVATVTAGVGSVVLTMLRINPEEMMKAMNIPPEQIEAVRQLPTLRPAVMLASALLSYVVVMGYAIYVRRRFHFNGSAVPSGAG
jgi:hypothetical protein